MEKQTLTFDATKRNWMRLPRLYIEAHAQNSDQHRSQKAIEMKRGECRILELEGEAVLEIFARYLLVADTIIWSLSIRDPLVYAEDRYTYGSFGDITVSQALIQYDLGRQYPWGCKRRTPQSRVSG